MQDDDVTTMEAENISSMDQDLRKQYDSAMQQYKDQNYAKCRSTLTQILINANSEEKLQEELHFKVRCLRIEADMQLKTPLKILFMKPLAIVIRFLITLIKIKN